MKEYIPDGPYGGDWKVLKYLTHVTYEIHPPSKETYEIEEIKKLAKQLDRLEVGKEPTKIPNDDFFQPDNFSIVFHWAENPYFNNKVIRKRVFVEAEYYPEKNVSCVKMECDKIDWKEGKKYEVIQCKTRTMKDKKRMKGRGRGKAQKTWGEEQPSLFNDFFRTLGPAWKTEKANKDAKKMIEKRITLLDERRKKEKAGEKVDEDEFDEPESYLTE